MSPARGNPFIRIRLEPEVMELLKERMPESGRGRGGGVSHFVRQLIYRELGLGEPPRFAAEVSPRKKQLKLLADAASAVDACLRLPSSLNEQETEEVKTAVWRAKLVSEGKYGPDELQHAWNRCAKLKELTRQVPEPAKRLVWLAFHLSDATRLVGQPSDSMRKSALVLEDSARLINTLVANEVDLEG